MRWIEMAALLPCTLFLAPLMFYGGIGLVFGIFGAQSSVGWIGTRTMLAALARIGLGLASLGSLWLLLLLGLDRVRRQPALCWSVVLLLVLGLADAAYFLLSARDPRAGITSDAGSLLMWSAMLGLPMTVGARHLYMLLRRLSAFPRSTEP